MVLPIEGGGAEMRISVRPEPRPDQTIYVTTRQEFAVSMSIVGSTGEPQTPQIITESVLAYKQVNGRFDDHGRMEVQLTVEQFNVKQSLNGTAKKAGNPGELLGRSFVAVLDRTGKLVDLRVPKETQQGALLKQLVAAAYGPVSLLPAGTVAVGATETMLSTIPLRLSGTGTSEQYRTRTIMVLRAIEKNGKNRIAHFNQRLESAPDMQMVKVIGTGNIDVNLDRGFVIGSTTEWTFAGDAANAPTSGSPAKGLVQGKFRITVEARE
jgi:hypothetical protein